MADFVKVAQYFYIGASTDTKPTACELGTVSYEYDTRRSYITHDGGSTWSLKKNSFPLRAVAYIFYMTLVSQANSFIYQVNPTLAAGDVKISKDGGAFANITTLPVVTPALGTAVKVYLNATEMTADDILIIFSDAAGSEWADASFDLQTT